MNPSKQRNFEFQLNSIDDTRKLSEGLTRCLRGPLTIALNGTLGAGKTEFVRSYVAASGGHKQDVSSPTYVLMQRYIADVPIYHIDFYRLSTAAEAWDLGLDELYEQPVQVIIEWAEKFPECLPSSHLAIRLEHSDGDRRRALVTATDSEMQQQLRHLVQH